MICVLLWLLLLIISGARIAEIDSDWLVWILACTTAIVTSLVELFRSRPVKSDEFQALMQRVLVLETQFSNFESHSISAAEYYDLKSKIKALENVMRKNGHDASSESSDD